MIGMTLCSGIGAPEMAAPWVDWRLASEIEPFPRAVLKARFGYKKPKDHNQGDPLLWGDMTEVSPGLLRDRGIPLPDVIVAGTPCQSFSVAGLRRGTEDPRGNLTLAFVEICHAIVDARPDGKLTVLWENVPGVLSDKGNAFGSFLGGLVGAMDTLIPSPKPKRGKSTDFWKWIKGGTYEIRDDDGEPTGEFETVEPHHRCTWPGEGMVQGPRARAAWCVLDAQWFGVAQRRRRVFVVVDFGGAVDPAAVLLEPDRLRGDTPPRREAWQDVAGTLSARTEGGGGLGTDFDLAGGIQPARPAEVAPTLNSHFGDKMGLEDQHALAGGGSLSLPETSMCLNAGAMGRQDAETETLIPTSGGGFDVAHTLKAEGFDASEDGTGRGTPLVSVFDMNQITSKTNRSVPMPELCHTLPATPNSPIAFDCKGTEVQTVDDGTHPTLRSMGHNQSHQNAGGHAAVAFDLRGRDGGAMPEDPHDTANLRAASGGSSRSYIAQPWAVRRLTPMECARLQGFPDNHCLVPGATKRKLDDDEYNRLRRFSRQDWGNFFEVDPDGMTLPADDEVCRLAADGPQYKAYGNSMAVPVIRWIMDRIRISRGMME